MIDMNCQEYSSLLRRISMDIEAFGATDDFLKQFNMVVDNWNCYLTDNVPDDFQVPEQYMEIAIPTFSEYGNNLSLNAIRRKDWVKQYSLEFHLGTSSYTADVYKRPDATIHIEMSKPGDISEEDKEAIVKYVSEKIDTFFDIPHISFSKN